MLLIKDLKLFLLWSQKLPLLPASNTERWSVLTIRAFRLFSPCHSNLWHIKTTYVFSCDTGLGSQGVSTVDFLDFARIVRFASLIIAYSVNSRSWKQNIRKNTLETSSPSSRNWFLISVVFACSCMLKAIKNPGENSETYKHRGYKFLPSFNPRCLLS